MARPDDRRINPNISKTFIHLSLKRHVHILQKTFSEGCYVYQKHTIKILCTVLTINRHWHLSASFYDEIETYVDNYNINILFTVYSVTLAVTTYQPYSAERLQDNWTIKWKNVEERVGGRMWGSIRQFDWKDTENCENVNSPPAEEKN
jgi:hypothetical protein